MQWTIAIVLILLWLLGMIGFGAASLLIHLLLIAAVCLIVLNVVQGRELVL